jgi:hypothetical protein
VRRGFRKEEKMEEARRWKCEEESSMYNVREGSKEAPGSLSIHPATYSLTAAVVLVIVVRGHSKL